MKSHSNTAGHLQAPGLEPQQIAALLCLGPLQQVHHDITAVDRIMLNAPGQESQSGMPGQNHLLVSVLQMVYPRLIY